jgi:hypothetical protein
MALTGTVVEPAADSAPVRRPRGRWRAVVAVATVLVVAVGAGWWYVASSLVWSSNVTGMVASRGHATTISNIYGTEYRYRPNPGDRLTIYAQFGPWSQPVTIVSVGSPFPDGTGGTSGLVSDVTAAARSGWPNDGIQWEPVASTVVPPDGPGIQLRWTFTIPRCASRNASTFIVDSVPVTFRYLGITHTVQADLGAAYGLASSPACTSAGAP